MFRLIDAEKTNYTITKMVSLLSVSRSGYYKWAATLAAGPGLTAVRRAALDVKVAAFHKASDDVYGTPRILADLREDGETVSRKTVAASMRRQRLQGISPRKFTPVTTIPDKGRANPEDLVDRVWDTGKLDRVWTSDITYLPTGQGWVYLCGCPRWMFPPCYRVGDGRPHAHRARHRGIEYGRGIPWAATVKGCIPRRPRHNTRPRKWPNMPRSTGWHARLDGPGCVGIMPSRNRTGQA